MPFENVSKRKLIFAPKVFILGDDKNDLKIALHETDYTFTERIIAPHKNIFMVASSKAGEFEKLPELTYIEGNFALPEGITVLASKLTKIEGDLNVGPRARFYAPQLQEVTGFIYVGVNATINAPKIEHMLANDDHSKISEETTPDWLNSL